MQFPHQSPGRKRFSNISTGNPEKEITTGNETGPVKMEKNPLNIARGSSKMNMGIPVMVAARVEISLMSKDLFNLIIPARRPDQLKAFAVFRYLCFSLSRGLLRQ